MSKRLKTSIERLAGGLCLLVLSGQVAAHGLISDPPARNAFCGMLEASDRATTPACVEAAKFDAMGMYSYMSVLTHDIGRQGLLSENVCGFDSETWQGDKTPWDLPLDWPTTSVESGPITITWDISMGPHFDDTEEFVYYITRADFRYEIGQALTWNDFETEPFCLLKYDDSKPTANPDIVADKAAALFRTQCQIPERSGRHVIYAEWGRNYFTYERFHGCVDIAVQGGTPTPEPEPEPNPQPEPNPNPNPQPDPIDDQDPPATGAAGSLGALHLLLAVPLLLLRRRKASCRTRAF